MSASCLLAPVRPRHNPLFAGIAAIFAVVAPTATFAATVTSCADDGGEGTLRSIVAAAASGDTIDFVGLSCPNSTITLGVGSTQIGVFQTSLTLSGNLNSILTIDGTNLDEGIDFNFSSIFHHYGYGTLKIENLKLAHGHKKNYSANSLGGCIYSKGNVYLSNATVTSCTATSSQAGARGGAVYALGDVTLKNSTVSYSSATANGTGALGGGVFATGFLMVDGGSIDHNNAVGITASRGGGAYVKGKLTLQGGVNTNTANATGASAYAKGGGACVLGDTDVSGGGEAQSNSANAIAGAAEGGGFYSYGKLTLSTALVSHNTAHGANESVGGGAKSLGDFSASYSTISDNAAKGNTSYAGALLLAGLNNTITASTISANQSDYELGGIAAIRFPATGATLLVDNSTISGNQAANFGGGLYSNFGTTQLYNSTIAFNTAGVDRPGVWLATVNAIAVTLKSNLIEYNMVGAVSKDFTVTGVNALTINGGNLAASAKNLIGATSFPAASLPQDTQIGVCARLGPLKDNGGLTDTHALLSKSPAIDAGNDTFGLLYDQRGKASVTGDMDYTRFSGPSAIADIGAYEVQQNDVVFNANFEGCPLL